MHPAILPGLILALAANLFGGSTSQPTGHRQLERPALYSIAAQAAATGTLTIAPSPSASRALTSTGSITGTATVTGTAAPTNTPIAVQTEAPQPTLQINPFDLQFLTSTPSPAMGPFAWAYLIIMALLFLASAYFYFYKRPEWKRTNGVYYRAANLWGQTGLWIAGLGLVFLLFRLIPIDFLNLRFWLYLWLLAAVAAVAWFLYWYNTSFKKQMARFQKRQRAMQYMPKSKASKARPNPPPTTPPAAGPASEKTARPQPRQSGNAQKRRKRR